MSIKKGNKNGEKEEKKGKRTKEKKAPIKHLPPIDISLACSLIKCQPLSNNISTENGKNDVL